MSLPTAYLTSYKNLKGILEAIQGAQAPKKFTLAFLEGLGYKSTADRLAIGVLKALGFLRPSGEPTQRYFDYLDQTQSARVLADAMRDAYADLYQVNVKAHELSNTELKNKLKTLSQGAYSDAVLEKMAGTFRALAALADFSGPPRSASTKNEDKQEPDRTDDERIRAEPPHKTVSFGGLLYNIQLQLPESRDQAVYDALFKSLKEHLL